VNFNRILTDDECYQQLCGSLININRKPLRPYHDSNLAMRGATMNEGWKVFWFFSAVFAAAFGAERTFVPGIVPVAFADLPQPLWAVGTAMVLRALELISGSVAFIALILMCGVWADHLRQMRGSAKAQVVPAEEPRPLNQ
jgi:hypothetical protein